MLDIVEFAATGSALLRTDNALTLDKDCIIATTALAATSTPPGQTGGIFFSPGGILSQAMTIPKVSLGFLRIRRSRLAPGGPVPLSLDPLTAISNAANTTAALLYQIAQRLF